MDPITAKRNLTIGIINDLYGNPAEAEEWADKVLAHDPDFKLPMTKLMREYKQLSEDKDRIEAEMKSLQAELLKQASTLDHPIAGLSVSSYDKITWDNEALHKWILANHPVMADVLTKRVPDMTAIENAVAAGQIGLPDPGCYDSKPVEVIKVDKPRAKAK